MTTVASNIKKFRTKSGMTQNQLAHTAKITQSYLSQVEAGRKTPSLAKLNDIAKALKMPPGDLLPRR